MRYFTTDRAGIMHELLADFAADDPMPESRTADNIAQLHGMFGLCDWFDTFTLLTPERQAEFIARAVQGEDLNRLLYVYGITE